MSGVCIAVIKMVRVKLTGRQPVRKYGNCDDRGVPDFMGVQTRQQIITKRDKGGIEATGTHRKRSAFLRIQESFTMKRDDILSLKPRVLEARTWL